MPNWRLVPLTPPYQKWTGLNVVSGTMETHYCNSAPFAGCGSVPPILNLVIAGGCFGFFNTVVMIRAIDGKYYGTMLVCGGTATAYFTLYDLPLSSKAFLVVHVAGLESTVVNANFGCSPPYWQQSGQTVTVGSCCGTIGIITTITPP